jgi:hypothetical protein
MFTPAKQLSIVSFRANCNRSLQQRAEAPSFQASVITDYAVQNTLHKYSRFCHGRENEIFMYSTYFSLLVAISKQNVQI